MSWSHRKGHRTNGHRKLPPERVGKKAIPPGKYIKKNLLLAALNLWELRKGLAPDPELVEARAHWKRRPHGC